MVASLYNIIINSHSYYRIEILLPYTKESDRKVTFKIVCLVLEVIVFITCLSLSYIIFNF